jgi:glycosyltransferase involved in cell wall biosynthesis
VAERLNAAGVPVTVAGGRPGEWRSWAERVGPHVLSTHFVDLEVVRALASEERPIFETVHNCYAWFKDADWQRERAKLEHVAGTIAVSETVAAYHARGAGGAASTHVIPNAVDPSRAAATPPELMRRRLGVPSDAPLFVHLGRFTVQKNLGGLLEAFRLALESVPAARLVLAGPVHERGSLRSLESRFGALIRSGAVRLLPPQAHVGALLSAADAFVSNSFYEGWSVAASEAAWCGLPLVLSECGGSRELVGAQGERGIIVPNPLGDPLGATAQRIGSPPPELLRANERALAEALVDVATSLDAWRARRGTIREWARTVLAPRRMGEAYATVLRAAAARTV